MDKVLYVAHCFVNCGSVKRDFPDKPSRFESFLHFFCITFTLSCKVDEYDLWGEGKKKFYNYVGL